MVEAVASGMTSCQHVKWSDRTRIHWFFFLVRGKSPIKSMATFYHSLLVYSLFPTFWWSIACWLSHLADFARPQCPPHLCYHSWPVPHQLHLCYRPIHTSMSQPMCFPDGSLAHHQSVFVDPPAWHATSSTQFHLAVTPQLTEIHQT